MISVITGGAGFIGSNLVEKLLASGSSKVVVFDSLSYSGRRENLPPDGKRFKFLKVDITQEKELVNAWRIVKEFSADPICLYHLAAESHVDRSIQSGKIFSETNVVGTQLILESASANNVSRFLHVSTDEVYGSIIKGSANERFPLNPTSAYSATKAASDLLVLAHSLTHNLEVVLTRCVNNYGARQLTEKLLPRLVNRAVRGLDLPIYGDGENLREWIHVSDHSEALMHVMKQGANRAIYNIGTGKRVTNYQIAELVKKYTKSNSKITFVNNRLGHDFRYAVNSKRIRQELGWCQKIGFEMGIRDTVLEIMDNAQLEENSAMFEATEKFYEQ